MVAFSYQWLGLVSMIGSERGLLDFGRRCDAFGRETGWTAPSLRDADDRRTQVRVWHFCDMLTVRDDVRSGGRPEVMGRPSNRGD